MTQGTTTYEQNLVEKFIALDQETKRLKAVASEKEKELVEVEAELLDLLNEENKKSSAKFKGIGHVTAMEPRVSNAYIEEGKQEALFEYLRSVGREDLIKTSVHHTSLAAFINQCLKAGQEPPPGAGYVLKQKLRAYPEKP